MTMTTPRETTRQAGAWRALRDHVEQCQPCNARRPCADGERLREADREVRDWPSRQP